jgi:hypothetical protein
MPPPLLPPPPLPSSSFLNATTSRPLSLGLLEDDTISGPTISLVNPNAAVLLDARKPTEKSSPFPLTPLIPSPIQAKSSKPMHPNSDYSSSPSDKIISSLSASLLPISSSGVIDASHNEDDDFSDFLSSPADPPLLTFSTSPPSQGVVPPSRSRSMSSDDLFVSHIPPPTGPNSSKRPDAALAPKPAGLAIRVAPANPTSSIAHRRKRSRAEEHMHTLDLVERAAARPGRWPAPPSPLPEVITPPPLPGSVPSSSADLNLLDMGPAPAPSNHQRQPSTLKETKTSSPSKAAVQKGHQRTQSLLDLAAARPGRWPAPPSPCHEAILPPPPPPARNQGGVGLNVDYFGTTPTEVSFSFSQPPPPPGKTSPPPLLNNAISPQMTLGRGAPHSTGIIDAMQSPSPPPHLSAPPPGPFPRRTLSPPPPPAAIVSKVPPGPLAPVPLLPPPSGYRITPPLKPPPRQYSPESTPLALLVDSGKLKSINLPAEKATPPPPVKGTGGLSAQDLSFFEGL